MFNIYDINSWSGGTTYNLHDVVFHEYNDKKHFWYFKKDNVTSSAPTVSNTEWGGVKYFTKLNRLKPEFLWKPSYDFSIASTPVVQNIKFGDGYEQRIINSVHNDLIKASLTFDGKTRNEARAISHFLAARRGQESFVYKLPPPYSIEKLFIVRNWNFSMKFFDNFNVKVTLEEVTL
jgi:phage-related protein